MAKQNLVYSFHTVQTYDLMEGTSSGVRKGAWNKIEDDLLIACIKQYGEGKWHLVPQRAGLKRCRKSCRLRWLNYLRPNIKRGDFGEDEIDLMIRMHKLLGNRWSLIAGRLPGRTANDVKNYWNTYLRKIKKIESHEKVKQREVEKVKPHEVVKPLPRTFKKSSPWLQGKFISSNHNSSKVCIDQANPTPSLSTNWWETMLDDNVDNTCSLLGGTEGALITNLWDQDPTSITPKDTDFIAEGQTWSDFLLDVNSLEADCWNDKKE